MIAITRYSRNRMRAWRFEYLRLPKTQDAYSALWTHWWFAQTIFANSLSQEDLSGLLIDDNTTEKECNLRPAVLSTAPAIRLTWKEIDLKTYRAMKTEERGNIYSGAWGCMVGNSLQVTYSRTTARETQKPELSQKQKQIHYKHFRVSCITKCVFMKQKDLQMN